MPFQKEQNILGPTETRVCKMPYKRVELILRDPFLDTMIDHASNQSRS